MLRIVTVLLALCLTFPAMAQSADDAAANRLFVEAVKARVEADARDLDEADITGWTRKRDLLVQVERNLRDIVDRHAGSGLAVRLILKEDIGGISLLRAAREAAAAREGLAVAQDVVAARRALDALEPSLARAREIADLSLRLAELQRLRPQLATIAERHARAQQAVAEPRALDIEMERLAVEIVALAAAATLKPINDAAGYDVYRARFTFVARVSSARSIWYDTGQANPTYSAFLLNPQADQQPAGTSSVWDLEGTDVLNPTPTSTVQGNGQIINAAGVLNTNVLTQNGPGVGIANLRYFRFKVEMTNNTATNALPLYNSFVMAYTF